MNGYNLFENAKNLNQFESLHGFLSHVGKLDTVTEKPVKVDGAEFDKYKALVYDRSNRPVSIVSDRYEVIQHKEVLSEVGDTFREFEVDPKGYITEHGNGRLTSKVYFQNPEYQFDTNTRAKDGDMVGLGLNFQNSYGNPPMALKMEGIAIRYICWNWNLWGDYLGKESVRHMGDVTTNVSAALKNLLENAPFLREKVREAIAYKFDKEDEILAALRGLRFGKRQARNIVDSGPNREKTWGKNPSLWAVYNAVTHFCTHRPLLEHLRDENLRRASRLLEQDELVMAIENGKNILSEEKED